jgi:putative RNA 2'-phosphotransferase
MDPRTIRRSKFLTLVLRHRPGLLGIVLDGAGWVRLDVLLEALERHGHAMTRDELETIVREDDKQRFELTQDGLRIRASQGHSVPVDLGYEPIAPPDVLYHGTVARFLESILATGLAKGKRHHVHLSETRDAARRVGERRGAPVVLEVRAADMARDGFVFYRSANGVWLTDRVPARYVRILD